jgi:hypothetical protein
MSDCWHPYRKNRRNEPPDEWVDQRAGLPEQRIISALEVCELLGVNCDRDNIRLLNRALRHYNWVAVTFATPGGEPLHGYLRDVPLNQACRGDLGDVRRELQLRTKPRFLPQPVKKRSTRASAAAYDTVLLSRSVLAAGLGTT